MKFRALYWSKKISLATVFRFVLMALGSAGLACMLATKLLMSVGSESKAALGFAAEGTSRLSNDSSMGRKVGRCGRVRLQERNSFPIIAASPKRKTQVRLTGAFAQEA